MRLLWKLGDLRQKSSARDQLLLRIGAANKEAGRACDFLRIHLPSENVTRQTLPFAVNKEKLKQSELRHGHSLLRANLDVEDPAVLRELPTQLAQTEAAFKTLKSELGLRPIYHQLKTLWRPTSWLLSSLPVSRNARAHGCGGTFTFPHILSHARTPACWLAARLYGGIWWSIAHGRMPRSKLQSG